MRRVDHYRTSVLHELDLSTAEKLLLLSYAEFMDFDTLGGARPGTARMMALTSLSRDSVIRVTRSVIAKRWLEQTLRGGSAKGGRRMASVYRGTVPDPSDGRTRTRPMVRHDPSDGRTPPSQGPGAPNRADALGPPNNTSRSNGRHAKGCTCYRCYHRQSQAHGLQADPRYS